VAESEHNKATVWKKAEERNENLESVAAEDGSLKWMPAKMRIMRKMLVSDQTDTYTNSDNNTTHKFDDQKQQLSSPLGTDNSSSNNYSNHSNNTVRVCSDCHTTKTPLWRSGPRGPKVHLILLKTQIPIMESVLNNFRTNQFLLFPSIF